MKITPIRNWFKLGRVNLNAEVKASTYRRLNRDLDGMVLQLERSVGQSLMRNQLAAQRKRIHVMIETCDHAEDLLLELLKSESEHNTFRLRWRFQNLKNFLIKYEILLTKYNVSFLEKIHYAINFTASKGLIVSDNLYLDEEGEIQIAAEYRN